MPCASAAAGSRASRNRLPPPPAQVTPRVPGGPGRSGPRPPECLAGGPPRPRWDVSAGCQPCFTRVGAAPAGCAVPHFLPRRRGRLRGRLGVPAAAAGAGPQGRAAGTTTPSCPARPHGQSPRLLSPDSGAPDSTRGLPGVPVKSHVWHVTSARANLWGRPTPGRAWQEHGHHTPPSRVPSRRDSESPTAGGEQRGREKQPAARPGWRGASAPPGGPAATAVGEEPVPESVCCPRPLGEVAPLLAPAGQAPARGGRGPQHDGGLGARRRPVPGEKMAGVRPATASWRFLAKPGIFQTSTPSKVAASMSRTFCSRSASARSFRPMLLSSCCTWGARGP